MEQEMVLPQTDPITADARADKHGPSQAAFVLGMIACVCNILLILAIPGFILGLIATIMGAANLRRHRLAKAGLVLGLLSFLPLATYLFSVLALIKADPFLFR